MLEFNLSNQRKLSTVDRVILLLLPMLCVVLLMTQTVFAKNTYRINDGSRVLVHTTYATDPAQVLTEAGLELGTDDTYVTQPGLGISEITVQRRQTVTILFNGTRMEAVSYGESVQALLDRLGLVLTQEDVLSVSTEAVTYDGMELKISRSVKVEEVYTAPLSFETVYCYDPSIPEGSEVVLRQGVDGQVRRKALVQYVDGQEYSRTVLEETVIQQPVDALVAVGTGAPALESPVDPGQLYIGDGMIITPEGETLSYIGKMDVVATAYTHTDPGCNEITATGTYVRIGVVAVDPDLIPYGTRMYIVTNDGRYIYGISVAEDCGGAIIGNRIDLYFETESDCIRFGIRDATIYFLG